MMIIKSKVRECSYNGLTPEANIGTHGSIAPTIKASSDRTPVSTSAISPPKRRRYEIAPHYGLALVRRSWICAIGLLRKGDRY
jgi:hypothetical protein